AKTAEVVIMVLGEQGFQSGEARSTSSLQLPGVQQKLLEAVRRVNKNIVLVLMNGRPLAITWAQEHIPAIIEAWQPGIQSGNAIANILFGKSSPSGRLTISFPRNEGQIPVYYNHYSTGRPDAKDVVFWSHYADIPNTPLYPFGYGLTYTTFKYS
ncbi:MAG TPA: glycosyl hydrolase, partial [Chitinophagaceae bacterium]|nr:glycosyl hydrolase [Chitinophagaceae bacterium]